MDLASPRSLAGYSLVTDTDMDGIINSKRNCVIKPNQNQRDVDDGGYGTIPDPD